MMRPEAVETTPAAILIVDDESEILVALTDLFEEKYNVLTAASGEEGLSILSQRSDIAVIISDQRMPGMTGDGFLTQARRLSSAGAILLTGYADIQAVESALNKGQISFFVYKPWDPETLLSMVAQAVERYRLEKALRREQALLRILLDNLPFGLAFKDEQDRFVRMNEQMASQLGCSLTDVLGRREEDIVSPERLVSLREAQSVLAAGGRDQQVIRLNDADGKTRWHDLTRILIGQKSRETFPGAGPELDEYSVFIDRDVTDLLSLDQRLQQAQKMQAIGTLAGGVAHDFNNLLTAIMGSLELVQELDPPKVPAVTKLYDNAIQAARRGGVLTQKLLDFSRPRHFLCCKVDIVSVLREMQDFVEGSALPYDLRNMLGSESLQAAERLKSVQFNLPSEPLPPVWTDILQLQLAVFNLCMNAHDAQPGDERITVSVYTSARLLGRVSAQPSEKAWVVVQVVDRGVGMTEETQARIFDPFFTTKDTGHGKGMSLSVIYGFINYCSGEIRVDSVPGGGTSIELWLPVMTQDLKQFEAAPAPVVPDNRERTVPPVSPSEKNGQTILVVDDEESVRAVTAGFLRHVGYTVLEADNGADGLALATQHKEIALVVMDVMMPGMNGNEAAQKMTAMKPGLPVLFVTGYTDPGLLPDDARVLHKPYRRSELLAEVKAILPS